jgi:hypothetical protein
VNIVFSPPTACTISTHSRPSLALRPLARWSGVVGPPTPNDPTPSRQLVLTLSASGMEWCRWAPDSQSTPPHPERIHRQPVEP